MLTTQELTQLVIQRPSGTAKGAAMHALQRLRKDYRNPAAAQVALLTAVIEQGTVPASTHRHPERDASMAGGRAASDNTGGGLSLTVDLTDSDRLWLQRLPEPSHVSYDDAIELARLARQVRPRTADARLVESVWRPVKARFDVAEARAELSAAKQPWPSIPSGVVRAAMLESIKRETTELTDQEISERASRLANDSVTMRTVQQGEAAEAAQRTIDALEAERHQREALTRT